MLSAPLSVSRPAMAQSCVSSFPGFFEFPARHALERPYLARGGMFAGRLVKSALDRPVRRFITATLAAAMPPVIRIRPGMMSGGNNELFRTEEIPQLAQHLVAALRTRPDDVRYFAVGGKKLLIITRRMKVTPCRTELPSLAVRLAEPALVPLRSFAPFPRFPGRSAGFVPVAFRPVSRPRRLGIISRHFYLLSYLPPFHGGTKGGFCVLPQN